MGVGAPPTHPAVLKVTRACNKTAASCHRHVCRKGKLCGSFCLQMEGSAPRPAPPAVLWPSMLAIKEEASCHHHDSSGGKLCRSFCLQMGAGGAAPPIPSLFSGRPCMQQQIGIMPSLGLQYGKVVRLVLLVLDMFKIYLRQGSYS